MIDSKELAEYLDKKLKGCVVKGIHGEYIYVKKPFKDELNFWIQQFKVKDTCGHSEWSETYKKNIWINDKPKKQ